MIAAVRIDDRDQAAEVVVEVLNGRLRRDGMDRQK